ncbi:ribonuclease III [Byssothecium circinans]|uniref:Ribonuclease III n=1 Tax=Byssothecium circinans TaxID=147558 RepID=A0A6A5T807_9PLEO|nr:ribonuclease III [Byssothecium circinans]
MSQKRSGSFNHNDSRRFKQQKTWNSQNPTPPRHDHNRNGYGAAPPQSSDFNQKFKNRDNPVLEHINRLPDPSKCEPCKLAEAEMRTGMIALLDKLEAENMTPDGDRAKLHHTRELRRILADEAEKSHSSQIKKKALDDKFPEKEKYVAVPSYIIQKLEKAKDLPPLPPITEPHLEEAVFTHPTFHSNYRTNGIDNTDKVTYERFEFLGDAYIELFASRLIYSRLPHVDVPQQSALREKLVKNETLGQFSSAYGLPDRLKHGGHIPEGTKAWTKVIADVFEAYVAGVILSDPENGFKTAEEWLTKLWATQMLDFRQEVIENPQARDDVQRLIQVKGVKLDWREERDMIMENGSQKYFMGLYFTGWGFEDEWLGSGEGRNKKQATVYAAMDAIKRNSSILQTAAKKKQELVQRVKEEKTKAEGNGDKGEDTTEKTEESTGDVKSEASSWLEKEKRKKEKKERKERKRKEVANDRS